MGQCGGGVAEGLGDRGELDGGTRLNSAQEQLRRRVHERVEAVVAVQQARSVRTEPEAEGERARDHARVRAIVRWHDVNTPGTVVRREPEHEPAPLRRGRVASDPERGRTGSGAQLARGCAPVDRDGEEMVAVPARVGEEDARGIAADRELRIQVRGQGVHDAGLGHVDGEKPGRRGVRRPMAIGRDTHPLHVRVAERRVQLLAAADLRRDERREEDQRHRSQRYGRDSKGRHCIPPSH